MLRRVLNGGDEFVGIPVHVQVCSSRRVADECMVIRVLRGRMVAPIVIWRMSFTVGRLGELGLARLWSSRVIAVAVGVNVRALRCVMVRWYWRDCRLPAL